MNDLYGYCQISKQAHYQALKRQEQLASIEKLVIDLILQTRQIHPGMGLRTIYDLCQPDSIGRDGFIQIGMRQGLGALAVTSSRRTTFASPYSRYPNLLVGKVLTGRNQLWTSDLTYFDIDGQFYYIVFIVDVYSRLIVGYSVAEHMRAESNLKALQMALRLRGQSVFGHGLIHHSDRGGQYISTRYVEALEGAQIQISMCREVYENSHVERVNGTLKNQYLHHWKNTNLAELERNVARAVTAYNTQRPHSSLQGLSPAGFEEAMELVAESKRPKLPIWTYPTVATGDPQQCILPF
jgi:putative transposase